MTSCKKGNYQILTQFSPINMLSLNHVSIPVYFSIENNHGHGFDIKNMVEQAYINRPTSRLMPVVVVSDDLQIRIQVWIDAVWAQASPYSLFLLTWTLDFSPAQYYYIISLGMTLGLS